MLLQETAIPDIDPVERRVSMRGNEAVSTLEARLKTIPAPYHRLALAAIAGRVNAGRNFGGEHVF